ncbi:periplasmic chaperone for outer membrane proteins SurA [Nicoletella semolina]|uniref:Periplasmic chaperone for outer membrane proteins SurA n=1 Tax=Nicoletella semolina TaxID=271160 RepID=A0A4R2N7D6_9PAST|nr:peptidylprolyl isomerase [Nicoletella semolina]MDH2924377.1 peptidylprolyl isomerase [Nicoletella semolina]TCP16844.1 periplasmic chaperone for outer membrane proteins SurA [Nicoletella semolina]
MKFTLIKSFFITIFALLALMQQALAEERVVATVDGFPIMQSQVVQALNGRTNNKTNLKKALEEVIDSFLFQRAVQESGITVNYDYINQMIENIAIENGLTFGQFLDALDYQGITLDQYRDQFAHQILMQEVRNATISKNLQVAPKDVQNLSKELLDKAKKTGKLKKVQGTEYKISHILIKTTPILNDSQAKAKLNNLLKEINGNQISFEQAAQKYSVDYASGADGGNLGWNFLDIYDPQFAQVAEKSKIGVISKPFKSQFGWHILKVADTRQGDRTEQAYLQKAYEQLINKQIKTFEEDWIKSLKQKATIKYF